MPWFTDLAVKRPIGWADARDDSSPATFVNLHLTASEADSQYSYFLNSRIAASNFHVERDGGAEQYINTDHISAAEAAGSNDAISIETEGADADGRWNPAQAEKIARLLARIHKVHGIPLVAKATSSPTERGIGWHRLGISGNFPSSPSVLRGRNQRGYAGESWSSSFGKVCPGNARILQLVNEIIPRARVIAGLSTGGGVLPKPEPAWKGAMGWPKLRPGDFSGHVKALQNKLISLGYSVGPDGADAKFGGDTEKAVKAFQKDHKLEQDAVVGAGTQKAMKTAKPKANPDPKPKPKPPTPKPKPPTIGKIDVDGKWGSDVTLKLQIVLKMKVRDGVISNQNPAHKKDNPGLTLGWDWTGESGDGGSSVILEHQKLLKKRGKYKGALDGKVGPQYFTALQADLGTTKDGKVSKPSKMVTALQKRLNTGKI